MSKKAEETDAVEETAKVVSKGPCAACGGTGLKDTMTLCPECDGSGT